MLSTTLLIQFLSQSVGAAGLQMLSCCLRFNPSSSLTRTSGEVDGELEIEAAATAPHPASWGSPQPACGLSATQPAARQGSPDSRHEPAPPDPSTEAGEQCRSARHQNHLVLIRKNRPSGWRTCISRTPHGSLVGG